MRQKSIELMFKPALTNGVCIIGFEGWGNALDVSSGMLEYLIRKLDAEPFGRVNPDVFYSYDINRPTVEIKNGIMEDLRPPGGLFYSVSGNLGGRDIILINASEPNFHWDYFIDSILSLCKKTGVNSIISLGSMYDNILHTDHIISGMASSDETMQKLMEKGIIPITYQGPSAIHSTLHYRAIEQGLESMSIWCHCPYYLQGTTHLGLLHHLGLFLSDWANFKIDIDELHITWQDLCKQIQAAIDENPEIEGLVKELQRNRKKGIINRQPRKDKIIKIKDFLKKEKNSS